MLNLKHSKVRARTSHLKHSMLNVQTSNTQTSYLKCSNLGRSNLKLQMIILISHTSNLRCLDIKPQTLKAWSLNHICSNTKKVCSSGETFNIASTKLQCNLETKVQGMEGQGKLENYKPTKICISGCTYPDPKPHVRICIAQLCKSQIS